MKRHEDRWRRVCVCQQGWKWKNTSQGGRVKSSSCSRRLDLLIHERRWHWHVWHTIFTQVIVFENTFFHWCLSVYVSILCVFVFLFIYFWAFMFSIFSSFCVCICDCILICVCICIHIFDMCDTPLWLKTWLKCFSQCVEGAVIYDTVKAWWWSDRPAYLTLSYVIYVKTSVSNLRDHRSYGTWF